MSRPGLWLPACAEPGAAVVSSEKGQAELARNAAGSRRPRTSTLNLRGPMTIKRAGEGNHQPHTDEANHSKPIIRAPMQMNCFLLRWGVCRNRETYGAV
jgi:hypothetical protein